MEEEIHHIVEESRKNQERILNLSHRDLKVIPAEISQLSTLHMLLLNNNQIIMPPDEVSHLKNLEYLSLESNQLTLLPSALSLLGNNLRFLNLSDNPFTYIPPVVGTLVNLRSLWLDHIGLTGFPSEICCLVNLEKLSLVENSISEISEDIRNLVNLRWLSLAKNKLPHLGQGDIKNCVHFTKLVKLETLVLLDNQVSEYPLVLCSLKRLANINLRRNRIFSLSSEAVCHIMQSTTLVKLDLRENPFNLQLESVCKDSTLYDALRVDNPRIIVT